MRYLRNLPRMWSSPVSDAVVALVAPIPGQLVVDLAAGMGPATVVAARRGVQVVAVDPTPFMRRMLRLRTVRLKRLVSVHDGAAESLPLADGSVDGLWSVNSMHHWGDMAAGLAEIARVLRPGGVVVLVDEAFDDPSHPFHERWAARTGGHAHGFATVDAAEVGRLLESHGCDLVSAGPLPIAGRPALVVHARRRN